MTIQPSTPPAGQPVRFAYALAVGDLNFQRFETEDPLPVGLQILAAAGLAPAHAYSLVAILPSGDFENLPLDAPYDLRAKGVERFIAFKTDRLFRLRLVEAELLWGAAQVPAGVLRQLVAAPADQALFLDVPGGQDQLIPDDGVLDLTGEGVEQVVLAPRPQPGFEVVIIYNGQPKPVRALPQERVQALFVAARAAFGDPPGDLGLFNEAGAQLDPNQTVEQAGVRPHARLLLRPRVVQGG
jgi:hypothetical protein